MMQNDGFLTQFLNKTLNRLLLGGLGGPRPPQRCIPAYELLYSQVQDIRQENLRLFRAELIDFYNGLSCEDRRAVRQHIATNFHDDMSFNEKYKMTRHLYLSIRHRPNMLMASIRRRRAETIERNSAWKTAIWREAADPLDTFPCEPI